MKFLSISIRIINPVACARFAIIVGGLTCCACGQLFNKPRPQASEYKAKNEPNPVTAVSLRWDLPKDPTTVAAYNIYLTSTPDDDKEPEAPQRIKTIHTGADDIKAQAPSIKLKIDDVPELEDLLGQTVCFTVTAQNFKKQESLPSSKVCTKL